MSLARSANRILKTSRRVLNASLATNVLVAVALCALLAPGVLLDYSDSRVLPRLAPGAPNLRRVMMPSALKMAAVFALAMGLWNVGLMAVLNSFLMAARLK